MLKGHSSFPELNNDRLANDSLDVLLADNLGVKTKVGRLDLLPGDRTTFNFYPEYLQDNKRPILSQSFLDADGDLIVNSRPTQTKLPAFFSNLLPEGHLRKYLSDKLKISSVREFILISHLGADLPGAIEVVPAIAATAGQTFNTLTDQLEPVLKVNQQDNTDNINFKFSLAGVQLKFSALLSPAGGLTIPTSGVGGDWILKLPSASFQHVPENECLMLGLAKKIGINVPETKLVECASIENLPQDLYHKDFSRHKALAVKRFDRTSNNGKIHIEDFAQVYNMYPYKKYDNISYGNIMQMIYDLMGEAGLTDFVRRFVFNQVIGNADMHLKNWSLQYVDPTKPNLAPAYDYVSTILYLNNHQSALSINRVKDLYQIDAGLMTRVVKKLNLPLEPVISTVNNTLENISLYYKEFTEGLSRSDQDVLIEHMNKIFRLYNLSNI